MVVDGDMFVAVWDIYFVRPQYYTLHWASNSPQVLWTLVINLSGSEGIQI